MGWMPEKMTDGGVEVETLREGERWKRRWERRRGSGERCIVEVGSGGGWRGGKLADHFPGAGVIELQVPVKSSDPRNLEGYSGR